MKEVIYRQAALDEFADLIEFIAQDKPEAARRVLQAVEHCIDHIAAFPLSGALVEGLTVADLNGMRRAIVTPYRGYVVFYFVHETSIEIVSLRRAEQSKIWSG